MPGVDALTQLYNSAEFQRRLAAQMARLQQHPEPLSLLLIDLDHFRGINQVYGYATGDAVLREFAQLLRANVLPEGQVFRYQRGDEFAILAPGSPLAEAQALAERLRELIEHHRFQLPAGKQSRQVTLSIGIASLDAAGDTGQSLLQRAQAAVAAAKKTTNCVVAG
jgi:two-component system cell cycle response regulator